MKKPIIIVFAILTMLGIVNTIAASIDKFSEKSTLSKLDKPDGIYPDVIYPCFWYFDNQWTGEEYIRDCYGCVLKWVDNPRYESACPWPW
jgi:hypothetical protein